MGILLTPLLRFAAIYVVASGWGNYNTIFLGYAGVLSIT